MSTFLSIFAATCRPHNITGFLDNLKETADDTSSFEVLLKFDDGATELTRIIEHYKKTSPLNIKYLETETLDGYYSLDDGYNKLLKIADPETYFCWLLTDEIRLKTKGWDTILKKQVGFFPDDIFRIKLSIFQLKNYNDFFECLPCPDNYAVTTRKWLEITGGWGNFWGPDSWHQCVDYYLGLCKNKENPYGVWRSYPLFDIKIGGQEAGQGIEDPEKIRERAKKIWQGWKKHSSHAAQENFNRLAQHLNSHIVACANNLNRYLIQDNLADKTVSLYDLDKKQCYHSECYKIKKLKFSASVGYKKIKLVHIFSSLAVHHAVIIRRYKRLMKIKASLLTAISIKKKRNIISHVNSTQRYNSDASPDKVQL